MKSKILAIGEIIWDVYPEKKTLGGAPLNFAAHTVLCRADSALISAVGRDELGDEAIEDLLSLGVDCKYIQRNERPTGQCLVTLDEKKTPHYNVLCDVAYDAIVTDRSMLTHLKKEAYDALYFGTLIQRDARSREAVESLVRTLSLSHVICDVNLRPNCYDRQSVALCLEHATILKLSIEEEPLLRAAADYAPLDDSPKEIARALCQAHPQLEVVIVTLGKDGSYAYDARAQKDFFREAVGDCVVSTVGAGDSYTAAFLTSYLAGSSIDQCMRYASEVSGWVVSHMEAIPQNGHP